MMPVTLAPRSHREPLLGGVDVFGGRDVRHGAPVRVAVQIPVCLSFAEILGLLSFTSAAPLFEELEDEAVIRESLQYAVLDTDLVTMEAYADRAMAAYLGHPMDGDEDAESYVRRLAVAVTRTFGVSA
ncbi:hypothetical protein ACFU6R_08775 [Streptomyces sp. NPDC057499]|uniref:hypothetical protein n=1 Tax=Streptomyces sp. NPDC057499 TaxID=3346150 RepID=UPI0036A7031C